MPVLQSSIKRSSLLDSELQQGEPGTHDTVRTHLRASLSSAEQVLNGLSASLELPRLLLLGDQEQIRRGAMERVQKVLTQREGCLLYTSPSPRD